MSTNIRKTIVVDVPVTTAYNQWTQFEDFPQFMGGVKSVKQLTDDRLEWVAEIGGVRRQWEAKIVEQVPNRRVAWAATEGATNAGAVTFEDAGNGRTTVHLFLEYEPEGRLEKVGDKLHVVEKRAEKDLQKFKEFIESEGNATGAWRGGVNEGSPVGTPGVEAAASSRGDEGKAGLSGKVIAAGAAALGAVAAAATKKKGSGQGGDKPATVETSARVVPTGPATSPVDPEAPIGPGTTATGEAAPVPGPDRRLVDEDVDADVDADPASRRVDDDDRPAGGTV